MVSQILSRLGVYMGPEKVLTVSAPDNQDGFWEDDAFVEINDEILASLPWPMGRDSTFDRGLGKLAGTCIHSQSRT